MATAAQVNANRKNAAKSTGPRTAQGKARVRLNAVTHGMTATAGLPHEDEQSYRRRVGAWTRELDAPGKLGTHLAARRAAHLAARPGRRPRAGTARQADPRGAEDPRRAGAGRAESVDGLIDK